MLVKHCPWGTCNSDSRFPQFSEGVRFVPFAKPTRTLETYHWRELPQIAFWSRQTRVCRDKNATCLSRQKCYLWQLPPMIDKRMLVATKLFIVELYTKVVSREAYFCRDKRRVLSRQKFTLAAPANDNL